MARPGCRDLGRRLWAIASRPANSRPQQTTRHLPRTSITSPRRRLSTNPVSIPAITTPNKSSEPPGQSGPRHAPVSLAAAGGVLLAVALALVEPIHGDVEQVSPEHAVYNKDNTGLPCYHLSEVKKHDAKSQRPWVTYQGKVYDLTDWIPAHPGGEVILRAAGGSIEPYWDIFSIHKTQHVRDILDQYVIGQVHPDDLLGDGHEVIEDPFLSDPERDPRLRLLTAKPCNAESPSQELADSFLTPNNIFYVRNHMWVPEVDDADNHEITVELPDGDVKAYTVRDLRTRFRQHTVTSVMQCSGNRRKDMTDHAKKTNGLQWTTGAISCAKWEGVLLRDVLADAGLDVVQPGEDARHVQFSALEAYGASIPITSALDPRGDVLLATRMNDLPLPRDHGFPVRVVVPGHVAARCVKWLKTIVVSPDESNTTWQRKDYKCFGPNETKQDWDKYKSIQEMPVTSAITRARIKQRSGGHSSAGTIEVAGYAYSGGGREIQRVDISMDGGQTWDQAKLVCRDGQLERGQKSWCWKRWTYEAAVPAAAGAGADRRTVHMVVKATDDAYNTQPESHGCIYNLRGNLATAWHRVDLKLDGESREARCS